MFEEAQRNVTVRRLRQHAAKQCTTVTTCPQVGGGAGNVGAGWGCWPGKHRLLTHVFKGRFPPWRPFRSVPCRYWFYLSGLRLEGIKPVFLSNHSLSGWNTPPLSHPTSRLYPTCGRYWHRRDWLRCRMLRRASYARSLPLIVTQL